MAQRVPAGLAAGGKSLWRAVQKDHELDAVQEVQLVEACRAKDRLDKLDGLLRGDLESWVRIEVAEAGDAEVVVDRALDKANTTANLLKQLLAALRLPDEASGKRPQQRGGARGAYSPRVGVGSVSSLDRARAAKSG